MPVTRPTLRKLLERGVRTPDGQTISLVNGQLDVCVISDSSNPETLPLEVEWYNKKLVLRWDGSKLVFEDEKQQIINVDVLSESHKTLLSAEVSGRLTAKPTSFAQQVSYGNIDEVHEIKEMFQDVLETLKQRQPDDKRLIAEMGQMLKESASLDHLQAIVDLLNVAMK